MTQETLKQLLAPLVAILIAFVLLLTLITTSIAFVGRKLADLMNWLVRGLKGCIWYKDEYGEEENIFLSLAVFFAMIAVILWDKICAMKFWLIKIAILFAMVLTYLSYVWAPINGGGL